MANIVVDHTILGILGKELTIPIFENLYMKGWMTASEIARELSVHISTAQSYLESMTKNKLLKQRLRHTRKNLVEYSLKNPAIDIKINVKRIISKKAEIARKRAQDMFIKEKSTELVSYEWDEINRKILTINIMKKSKSVKRVRISKSIQLSDTEGRFLWFIPHPTENPKNVIRIAEVAGITETFDLIKIVDLLEMLAYEKIIILKEKVN
jgi:predicted transcriptional regulator